MRKKRIMIIGPSKSGKTTLANELNGYTGPLRRTSDIIYGKNTKDVPSAYIENSWMYKHVIAVSQDASKILILVDQSNSVDVYSPGWAKLFNCPVIGVITKSDMNPENRNICLHQLKRIGVNEPYFDISFIKRTGIDVLKKYLFEKCEE